MLCLRVLLVGFWYTRPKRRRQKSINGVSYAVSFTHYTISVFLRYTTLAIQLSFYCQGHVRLNHTGRYDHDIIVSP
ncbi:hypothetical protein BDR03DRAFT_373714 [Suillus americanus]|nr:hypothetical protein BDR03DRAFT_373714 [Suillus americanus]